MNGLTVDAVVEALQDVKDPEIPVVSVVELGIVQGVHIDGTRVTVAITPTFSGCPAVELMRAEIAERIGRMGATSVDVPIVLDPPWSSDRIAPAARERMREIGLAPPAIRSAFDPDAALMLSAAANPVACPFCGAADTTLENAFGPTICRAIHYCNACRQPFEEFKAL